METINSVARLTSLNFSTNKVPHDASVQRSASMENKQQPDSVAALSSRGVENMSKPDWVGADQNNGGSEKRKELEKAVSDMNQFFQVVQRNLQFTLDEESNEMVVQIKDEKGDVIKQVPSEEALELARRLDEVRGLLFKEMV